MLDANWPSTLRGQDLWLYVCILYQWWLNIVGAACRASHMQHAARAPLLQQQDDIPFCIMLSRL